MRVRENLSSVVSSIGKNNFSPPKKIQIGRVYGVVTTENTPTKEMFENVGGFNGVGTIFYLDYAQSKEIVGTINNEFFKTCKRAKPLYPQYQYYPLIGELVFLEDLASPVSQISNTSFSKYYISVVNLWTNNQQNSQPANDNASLGSTFSENSNIKSLISYQGDYILNSRQGSSLRFSTVTRGVNPSNEWSQIGNEIDPITILTNGLAYDPTKQYYVEQINKDASSIYLTSTQKIPLQTDKTGVLNNLTNPLNVSDYTNSQIILNGDRIVLNSKKDEVMLFAKTNIELNTKNTINLNADERVYLNTNNIFLGKYDSQNIPQPVLLGNNTLEVFILLQQTLTTLGSYLQKAVSTSEGSPIVGINVAGKEIINDMNRLCDLLNKITSTKVFTI
jgi:hypothetical protein